MRNLPSLKDFQKNPSKSNKMTAQDTIPFDEIYDNGLIRKDETLQHYL